jgi:flagellar motility protein MotE (MotC chaperone)
MAKKEEPKKERTTYNIFEKFFFILLIPTIFALALTAALVSLVLYAEGYDVKNTLLKIGKQIPYVADYVPAPDIVKSPEQLTEETVAKLRAQLASRLSELSKINLKIEEKDKYIADLENKITDLSEKLKKKTLTDDEYKAQIQSVADLYGRMPANKAAPIIENLTLPEIVLLLGVMTVDQRMAILQKMDPQKAAESSILLKDTVPAKDREIAALQSRISALNPVTNKDTTTTTQAKLTKADIASTFTNMPPKTASEILQSMLITNEKQVVSILTSMDNATRSKVLAQMPIETAAYLTARLQ